MTQKTPLPKLLWKRGRKGMVICQCGCATGSEFDGLCFRCRGKISAYEAAKKLKEIE
jgi:hypothetical protein